MLLIARWLVKLIPFFYFDYLIPLGYKNQENCKIAGKIFRIKYHVTHCNLSSTLIKTNYVLRTNGNVIKNTNTLYEFIE